MGTGITDEEKRRRFRAYIEREGLASLMNDTKWRKMIDVLSDCWRFPTWRVKYLADVEPGDFRKTDHEPQLRQMVWREVEWIEFAPIERTSPGALMPKQIAKDHRPKVEEALRAAHVPYSIEGELIRVWGYARPGRFPELAFPKAGGTGA